MEIVCLYIMKIVNKKYKYILPYNLSELSVMRFLFGIVYVSFGAIGYLLRPDQRTPYSVLEDVFIV